MKLELSERTCDEIFERLDQAVEDLTRWLTGGQSVLSQSTKDLLSRSLEDATEAFAEFSTAYDEAALTLEAGDAGAGS